MSNAVNRTLMMNKKILTCIIATLLGGTICAGNRYVSHLTGNDGDGKSWANAKTSISAAIFDVGVGDTMFIAEGPYYESISVQDGATYLGGYNAETGERDVNLYETTIIGSGDDSYLIVKYDAAPENHILIDGITIPYGSMSSFGAPVYLRGNMTLSNCRISHCSGAQAGAIYLEQGEATAQGVVSNCIIEFCTSTDYAGAIYNDGGIVENCIIRGCQGKYSGIYNRTNGIIQNCVLYNNSGNVASSRGCIYCLGGQVINCTVCNNYGTQYSGIYLSQGQVVNCVFWGNQSEEGFTNPPNYISSSSDSHHNITDNGTSADAFLSITLNIENNAADGPNFVNPTTFVGVHTNVEDSIAMISADFSLTAASTALLSQADASLAPSTDIIGIQRPQGAGVDIGTYEFTGEENPSGCTIASGKCGAEGDSTNVVWSLSCDSVLTISGSGAMADYTYSNKSPWYSVQSKIKHAIIDYGVTNVGNYALYGCSILASVSIPNSVTSIGKWAFYSCKGVTSVTIPNSVTTIQEEAFYACSALADITIPNSVTSIGYGIFYGCSGLTSITIPSNVTIISSNAFRDCSSLTNVDIPDKVTTIGEYAFSSCSNLTNVNIPNSVKNIEAHAFSSCSKLTSITIPYSVTSIVGTVFFACTSLTSIIVESSNSKYCDLDGVLFNKDLTTLIKYPAGKPDDYYIIPESVTSIGDYAFSRSSNLKSVKIPNSVKSIGKRAFLFCNGLKSITIPNSITSIEEAAFNGCKNLTYIFIPSSVTSIGEDAFSGCSSLANVSIPSNVTSIGGSAFYICSNLTSFTCEAETPPTCGTSVFYNVDKSIPLYVPSESIELYRNADIWKDFKNIQSFPCITASGKCGAEWDSTYVLWSLSCDSVLTISGTGATAEWSSSDNAPWYTYHDAITSITLSEGITSIGNYAFYVCSNLNSIDCNNPIPAQIGESTFDSNTLSTCVLNVPYSSVSQYQSADYWSLFAKINEAKCILASGTCGADGDNLTWEFTCDSVLTITGAGDMDNWSASNTPWYSNRNAIKHVSLPNELTSIGSYAFRSCTSLTDIVIPDDVTTISKYALSGCSKLTEITIGSGVNSIGNYAFQNCTSLATVYNYATTPLVISGTSPFSGASLSTCTLYVPEQSIELYQTASVWKDFGTILPINNPPSGCTIASGKCGEDGDNLTWVLGCDSVLTISGEGEMPTSYSGTSAPWYQYGQAIKHINIEEGVTKLALYAFYNSDDNYPNVQTLSIPSTLGAPIENNFFYQCPLKTVTINSDTIVGRASYSSNSSLQTKFGAQVEEYIIGGSVRSIADFAFRNQSPDSLRSIILPEGLEAIGNWAFGYIEHLTSINIPSTVQTIGTDAFAYCTNLRSVELGEGLMTVNGQAFWMCDSLTRVTCNALTPPTLNQTAFDHNLSDTLFIPCEAKTAYQEADYWKNFSKIICADDTLQIIASGTCGAQGDNLMWVFDRDSVLTISGSGAMADWVDGSLVPWYDVREDIRTVIIEEGVTTIGDRAFYYFTRLIDVSYPTTLTSIGIGVFDFCSALPEIDGLRYAGAYLAGVPVMAQDTITTYTIRQGTRFIGHSAFHGCSQLKRITLPEGVTHILSSAFTGCNRLTKIDLPATVTDIQRYAFESDTLLTTFINRAVTPQTLPSSTSESAFYNCKLSKCTLYVPEESISLYQAAPYWQDFGAIRSLEDVPCILAEGTFGAEGDNLSWKVDCDDMLTISGSGEMEFFHASEPWANFRYQLRKIVVEEGVTNLSNVFRLHNQVTEVSLPNTLRVIEAQAFDQCSSITHLELPESVDSIGEGVFYLCESLQEIRIPSRVTMINSSLFRGCRGLRSVEFPNGLTRILTTAFQYCNELNALHLPASLTFIGQEAFADCTGLDTITVLATTPPEVTQSAFDNVPDTTPVFVPTASLRAYRNHEEWSYFKNIHGIDGDGPETHTFTLTSSWQFIMLPTMFGLTQDDIVVDGEIEWGIYNSEQRASGRSGWQGFVPTSGFEGSQAYIVRANGSATLTIHIPDQARDQAAATMPISYHPATREQNANWNFLGNPYPYSYDILSALEEAEIESPVTVWNGTGYDVFTPGIDLKTLDPFEAFFIQLPDGGSEVLPLSPEHIKDSSSSNSVADENGALPGYFTINTSKEKVQFSRGNLQYQASTATWQFAENQYDVIGEGNVNISATYDGWIDLFGWGTGDNPTKASTSKCDYSSFVDWGINAISNGGNTADMWRTLSANEWTYITGQRTNYESLCGRATVNGIQGFILLPDDWVSPGIPFQGSKDNGYELNQFTLADWQKMEAAGAVFLPACGSRTGTEFSNGAVQYWSTNAGSSCYAYDIITGGDTAFRLKTNQVERSSAFGVRLVK